MSNKESEELPLECQHILYSSSRERRIEMLPAPAGVGFVPRTALKRQSPRIRRRYRTLSTWQTGAFKVLVFDSPSADRSIRYFMMRGFLESPFHTSGAARCERTNLRKQRSFVWRILELERPLRPVALISAANARYQELVPRGV